MKRTIRKQLFEIIKEAGQLSDLVQKTLEGKTVSKKTNYTNRITLSNGLKADIPANPFGPNGAVNIMFMFRYYSSSPPWKNAGVNQVVIHGDVKRDYNNPKVISNSISQVIGYLKKKNPKAHLGKYGMSGFSGGYWPIENLLRKRKELESSVGKELDAVFLADAGATKLNDAAMSGFTDFAREASDLNSGKKFVVMHSAIPGGKKDPNTGEWKRFTSTKEHSEFLMNKLNMQRQNKNISQNDPRYAGLALRPQSITNKGNFYVIESDNQGKRKWIPGKEKFTPGTSGWVHRQIVDEHLPTAWNQYLQDWD